MMLIAGFLSDGCEANSPCRRVALVALSVASFLMPGCGLEAPPVSSQGRAAGESRGGLDSVGDRRVLTVDEKGRPLTGIQVVLIAGAGVAEVAFVGESDADGCVIVPGEPLSGAWFMMGGGGRSRVALSARHLHGLEGEPRVEVPRRGHVNLWLHGPMKEGVSGVRVRWSNPRALRLPSTFRLGDLLEGLGPAAEIAEAWSEGEASGACTSRGDGKVRIVGWGGGSIELISNDSRFVIDNPAIDHQYAATDGVVSVSGCVTRVEASGVDGERAAWWPVGYQGRGANSGLAVQFEAEFGELFWQGTADRGVWYVWSQPNLSQCCVAKPLDMIPVLIQLDPDDLRGAMLPLRPMDDPGAVQLNFEPTAHEIDLDRAAVDVRISRADCPCIVVRRVDARGLVDGVAAKLPMGEYHMDVSVGLPGVRLGAVGAFTVTEGAVTEVKIDLLETRAIQVVLGPKLPWREIQLEPFDGLLSLTNREGGQLSVKVRLEPVFSGSGQHANSQLEWKSRLIRVPIGDWEAELVAPGVIDTRHMQFELAGSLGLYELEF